MHLFYPKYCIAMLLTSLNLTYITVTMHNMTGTVSLANKRFQYSGISGDSNRIKFGDLVLSIVERYYFNTVSLYRSVLFERFHCTNSQ